MTDTPRGIGTCWIEVDLAALRSNYRVVHDHLEGDPPVLAVVKANAYGHGAVAVSKALLEEGATVLGVATVEEAMELREGGIEDRILILGRMVKDDIPAALRWHTESASKISGKPGAAASGNHCRYAYNGFFLPERLIHSTD